MYVLKVNTICPMGVSYFFVDLVLRARKQEVKENV